MSTDDLNRLVGDLTLWLAHLAEIGGALVVGVAAVRALIGFLISVGQLVLGRARETVPKEAIRLNLGRSLALALEFELGADILKTVVAPNWNEIAQLAAIVVLRTALNYFLQRELDAAAARDPRPSSRDSPAPGRPG
jgi:uncharacterized membrane protein